MAMPQRAGSTAKPLHPYGSTVQWNEPLDAVLARMDVMAEDEAFVLEGDRLVGRILRSDIEHLRQEGNWAGCIAAVDTMDRNFPRRTMGAALEEA
jgi:hypothetical protein